MKFSKRHITLTEDAYLFVDACRVKKIDRVYLREHSVSERASVHIYSIVYPAQPHIDSSRLCVGCFLFSSLCVFACAKRMRSLFAICESHRHRHRCVVIASFLLLYSTYYMLWRAVVHLLRMYHMACVLVLCSIYYIKMFCSGCFQYCRVI